VAIKGGRNDELSNSNYMCFLAVLCILTLLNGCTQKQSLINLDDDEIIQLVKEGNAKEMSSVLRLIERAKQGDLEGKSFLLRMTRLLAEQGDVDAQYHLGYTYLKGKLGVHKDYVMAHMYFNIAASNGHKKAIKRRDNVGKNLIPSQLDTAQELALKWMIKHQ